MIKIKLTLLVKFKSFKNIYKNVIECIISYSNPEPQYSFRLIVYLSGDFSYKLKYKWIVSELRQPATFITSY